MKTIQLNSRYCQLPNHFASKVAPSPLHEPFIIHYNDQLARQINLPDQLIEHPHFRQALMGQAILPGSIPLAMKYTGHQFGYYNPDLGDGRGLLLGEWIDEQGQYWEFHLKGAGQTPYSRQGDGRAVLRSSIREYLASEAMHGLGIPTTRALCLTGSHEQVLRESVEQGAMLTRISQSHIRFGHFEYFYYQRDHANLKRLADFVIEHHYPELAQQEKPYLALLQAVIKRTAELIAHWQAVGFNHGVMNTDNMSIIGDTFDYGPFAFLDDYQANYVCNHSDHQGRYAFDQQARIGLWNCHCLAQAMLPLIHEEDARQALSEYEDIFAHKIKTLFAQKLGLTTIQPEDASLIQQLLTLLHNNRVDYTTFFRRLTDFRSIQNHGNVRDLFIDRQRFDTWADTYDRRLQTERLSPEARQKIMQQANPKYILRNYLAQIAITKAEEGDYSEIDRLLTILRTPYDEQPAYENYASPPPDWGKSMSISCSS